MVPQILLDRARGQARKSPMASRHGAIIVDGRRVVSSGYNMYLSSSYGRKWSIHAEEAVILEWCRRGRPGADHAKMIVVRVDAQQRFAMSRPCRRCEELIQKVGLACVYYTTG